MRLEWQSDVDLVDVLALDDLVDLAEIAEYRHARDLAFGLPRVVIEKADNAETELSVVLQLLCDFLAQRPGSQDEDALQVLTLQSDDGQDVPNHIPTDNQQNQIQASEDGQESTTVGEGLQGAVRPGIASGSDPRNKGPQQHGGQQHRNEDGQRFIDPCPASADLVEAMEVEHDRPEQQNDRQEQ